MRNPSWLLSIAMLESNLRASCLARTTTDTIMEVSFPSSDGNMQLEGTLRLPCLGCTEPPLAPGVVLIHGSGPQSRDSVIPLTAGFSIPVFEEIATSLVQDHGIAVLTYDKRTCGAFNNCNPNNQYPVPSPNVTIDDFIADAAAAVELFQARPDVGPVVVVGHSQGGQLVPILLEENPDLAGGVMLAGPYNTIDKQLRDQYDFLHQTLLQQGLDETAAAAQSSPMKAFSDGVEAVKNGNDQAAVGTGSSALFWKSWFDAAERALDAAAVIEQPLLLINGLQDKNVFPPEAEAWDAYLTDAGASYQLEMPPCITHALNCVNATSLVNATDEQIGRHVDTDVIASIANFVLTVAHDSSQDVDNGGGVGSGTATAAPGTELDTKSTGGQMSVSTFYTVMALLYCLFSYSML